MTRLNPALRRLFRAPVYLFRWKCSWLFGHRFLLLIHTGRRTGLRRCTVLEVIEFRKNGPEAVVVSAFGRSADWLRNIEAIPGAEVVNRLPTICCRPPLPRRGGSGASDRRLRAAQPAHRADRPLGV